MSRKAKLKPVTARQFRYVVNTYAKAYRRWLQAAYSTARKNEANPMSEVDQEMRGAEERVLRMGWRLEAMAAEIAAEREAHKYWETAYWDALCAQEEPES